MSKLGLRVGTPDYGGDEYQRWRNPQFSESYFQSITKSGTGDSTTFRLKHARRDTCGRCGGDKPLRFELTVVANGTITELLFAGAPLTPLQWRRGPLKTDDGHRLKLKGDDENEMGAVAGLETGGIAAQPPPLELQLQFGPPYVVGPGGAPISFAQSGGGTIGSDAFYSIGAEDGERKQQPFIDARTSLLHCVCVTDNVCFRAGVHLIGGLSTPG